MGEEKGERMDSLNKQTMDISPEDVDTTSDSEQNKLIKWFRLLKTVLLVLSYCGIASIL